MNKYIYLLATASLLTFSACNKSNDVVPIQEETQETESLRTLGRVKTTKSIRFNNWMSALPNDLPIHRISIPGTHDSGANKYVGITTRWAQTQELSIRQQLSNGIRFLDIRVSLEQGNIELRHGSVRLGYNLQSDVLDVVRDFLKKNPSETVLMTIKHEYNDYSGAYASVFEKQLNDIFYNNDKTLSKFMLRNYSENTTLGEARGKMIILSRNREFSCPAGYIPNWYDNRTFESGVYYELEYKSDLFVEDKYKLSIDDKIKVCKEYIGLANEHYQDVNKTLNIGFTSSTGPISASWPSVTSAYINPEISKYLRDNKDIKYCGILVNNFATANDALTKAIIDLNHRK